MAALLDGLLVTVVVAVIIGMVGAAIQMLVEFMRLSFAILRRLSSWAYDVPPAARTDDARPSPASGEGPHNPSDGPRG